MIVVNDRSGQPFEMAGDNAANVNIPSMMISQADGNSLFSYINNQTVSGFLYGGLNEVDVLNTYDNYPFSSLRHWGENSKGNWTLSVLIEKNTTTSYSFGWSLNIYYSGDDSKVRLGLGLGLGLGIPILLIIIFVIYHKSKKGHKSYQLENL